MVVLRPEVPAPFDHDGFWGKTGRHMLNTSSSGFGPIADIGKLLRLSRLHDGFQKSHRLRSPVGLTFLEILRRLPHGIGHMSDAQDLGLASLGKRIERRRLHLDGEDAPLLRSLYCFCGFAERRVSGPSRTDDGT